MEFTVAKLFCFEYLCTAAFEFIDLQNVMLACTSIIPVSQNSM